MASPGSEPRADAGRLTTEPIEDEGTFAIGMRVKR
jgi:hypothetical protein